MARYLFLFCFVSALPLCGCGSGGQPTVTSDDEVAAYVAEHGDQSLEAADPLDRAKP